MKYFFQKNFILSFTCCIIGLTGCGESKEKIVTQFLLKTPLIVVSKLDFSEELDRKKAAYPYDIRKNPIEYNEMVIHLVKILSDEIVLLSAAADKDIKISDQEVESAEKEFKKEYPADSFDQILLESAISYSLWKKRFKNNMIIEKLIEQEIKEKIDITPRDIEKFYNNNYETSQDLKNNSTILNKNKNAKDLVARLFMQKSQKKYNDWIQNLYKAYPVEINRDKLKSFLIGIKKGREYKNGKEN